VEEILSKGRFLFPVVVLAVILAACGSTGDGTLQVKDAWARPGLADGNSALFFEIDNPVADDTLLSVSSDVAGAVELHKTVMEDGVMQMFQQRTVPVPRGKTTFEPGGLHVMLVGLKNDLSVGDSFDVTLNFETAGERTLTVTVKEP